MADGAFEDAGREPTVSTTAYPLPSGQSSARPARPMLGGCAFSFMWTVRFRLTAVFDDDASRSCVIRSQAIDVQSKMMWSSDPGSAGCLYA